MAHMNQQKKAVIVSKVKPVLKKYGLKGTFSVRNHMTICLTITSGSIDFIENYIQTDINSSSGKKISDGQIDYIRKNNALDINPHWYQDHFTGKALDALTEIMEGMHSAGYYNNTDIQSDYFDTAYYVDVNVGTWNRPYTVL
jgi:hypothetical protein